ncbi:MAG: 30S ribosome-binding factor RbfA, partial [Desulfobacterales bacterium]
RSERVGGLIQKKLSILLQREISDPRLRMATISGVNMSRDLRTARIYFTVSGGEANRAAALDGFNSARGYVKRTLAGQLGLRYMPELKFFYDESFDYGSKIDNALKSIKIAAEDETDHSTVEE